MLIPLATNDYWNSASPYSFNFREGHSPLADSIMTGNLEMVQIIIQLTNLNVKPHVKSGNYIHVALRYGQFEIFVFLCAIFKNWRTLKCSKGQTVNQILANKDFKIEVNDMESGPICGSKKYAKKDVCEEFRGKMMNFIRNQS